LSQTAGSAQGSYLRGKLAACRYFAEFELPKVAAWLYPIELGTDVTVAMPLEEFLGEVA
jgi:hypothetical protein